MSTTEQQAPQPQARRRASTQARHRSLLSMLDEPGGYSIHQLAQTFGVSASTIRRDLRILQADRSLLRIYGGAISARQGVEPSWHTKEHTQGRAKHQIAIQASSLIKDNNLVMLDAGTTTAAIAAILGANPTLTIATTGLSSVLALADSSADLIVVGGRLRRPNAGVVGPISDLMLDMLEPDAAFVGCDTLDPIRGINCPDPDQAALKRRILDIAKSPWVVADSTKFVRSHAFPYWVPLPPCVGIITDQEAEQAHPDVLSELRKVGHRVAVSSGADL